MGAIRCILAGENGLRIGVDLLSCLWIMSPFHPTIRFFHRSVRDDLLEYSCIITESRANLTAADSLEELEQQEEM